MKSLFAFCILFGVLSILVLSMDITDSSVIVRHGNHAKEPLEIVLEKYICSESKSPITELYNSAQAILPDGTTYFFNDVGNLILWLNRQKQKEKIVTWVYTKDTERYILTQNGWYSRTDMTPMGYGFGVYEYRVYGKAVYYFDEVTLFALRGETLMNPFVNLLLTEGKL